MQEKEDPQEQAVSKVEAVVYVASDWRKSDHQFCAGRPLFRLLVALVKFPGKLTANLISSKRIREIGGSIAECEEEGRFSGGLGLARQIVHGGPW